METEEVAIDPRVRDHLTNEAHHGPGTTAFPEVSTMARLMGMPTSHKRNGANFAVIFEMPLYMVGPVNMMPDGLSMRFTTTNGEIIDIIEEGAYLKSTGTTRDPDGGRHLKATFQLPASALGSLGALGILLQEDRVDGTLLLKATQGSMALA